VSSNSFDYIVVGAGSAGCIVAAKLAKQPSNKVLLIEAGPAKSNIWTRIPIGYYKNIFNPKLTWQYKTEPEPLMYNRSFSWPRGKLLGGSSMVNGLIHIRGQTQDFDLWEELGNRAWGYRHVLPYFKNFERQERGSDEYHGTNGPIGVSDMRDPRDICQAFIDAGHELGIRANKDFNGPAQEGVGLYQLTVWDGVRTSSADYLKDTAIRSNLKVQCNAHVQKIQFQGSRAVGVSYLLDDGIVRQAAASAEIILCAGAIGSPQILQLSGVGDGGHLQSLGIKTVHDLPGVGQNLLDHLQVRSVYKCKYPVTINDINRNIFKKINAGIKYLFKKGGPLTIGAGQAAAFMSSEHSPDLADMEIIFMGFSTDGPGKPPHTFPGFTILGYQLRPESKGYIKIVSPDAAVAPSIVPNYLSEEIDRKVTVSVLKTCRAFAQTASLQKFVQEEYTPGDAVADDDQILDFARREGSTVFHPTSTCRMGIDQTAVVDERLKVKDLQSLRVVDASIMPTMVSGNTCAAVFMIGEKGAEMIQQDAKRL
jgi:choline dehydrogenase